MEYEDLKARIAYLEGKCAFLSQRLASTITLYTSEHPNSYRLHNNESHIVYQENERLKKKVLIMQKSVSWVVTKPLRMINIQFVDRWWRKIMKI